MIDRLIELSARNRGIVVLLIAAAVVAGWWSMKALPLDATPDLSETQVIVYSRWDRSPDIMEDQVTYPIVTAMLGAPKVKDVRGFSDFGYSYVYVIFDEGTDLYWARSRTMEYLSKATSRLPPEVKTELGPDATGVGWVFQYALVDTTGKRNLADLRSIQDWYLRYHLEAVPGVAEIAPLGGFVRQYQINVDPGRLQSYDIPVSKLVSAIRSNNNDVGGRVVELTGREYMVRGRGYIKSARDLEGIVLATSKSGVPVTVKDVGEVVLGPDMRRGLADLDGNGETVSGIVVMRQGSNALDVIKRVKAKIKDIEPGLPAGVKLVTAYDRSELILASIRNLKSILIEELIVVSIVILIFLWHPPSALIPIFTIPVAVIVAFIPMRMMGLSMNVMSLGGIAIAIGAVVDASIGEGGWRRQFLRAPGHCCFFSAGADPGSAGRQAVQTACIYQELHDGGSRTVGDHARSGAAPVLYPDARLRISAEMASKGKQCGIDRQDSSRRRTPHQPPTDSHVRSRGELDAAPEVFGNRERFDSGSDHNSGVSQTRLGVYATAG
jgi:copper/silver efflux system protein